MRTTLPGGRAGEVRLRPVLERWRREPFLLENSSLDNSLRLRAPGASGHSEQDGGHMSAVLAAVYDSHG